MKTALNIILMTLFFFTTQVKASPLLKNCESIKKNNSEYGKCLDQAIDAIDRTLSIWIENQTFALEAIVRATGRKTVQKLFKKSHQDFISYRKNDCRWQYLVISPDANAAAAYKTCYISLSQKRVDQLKAFNKKM
jgi:uncharacterized protein YecT (DUF1311 family)